MSAPAIVRDLGSSGRPDEDASEILVTPSTGTREALRRLGPGRNVSATVPDVEAWVRDASDLGVVGAAMRRVRRAGPRGLIRAAAAALASPFSILRGDPAAMMRVLLALELARLGRVRPRRIVLAAGITDLAVAARNRRMLETICRWIRRRDAAPWLETRNVGHLLPLVRTWGLDVAGVVTPLNPRGRGMKPALATCLDELRRTTVEVWARDVGAGGAVAPEEARAFAREAGAAGVILSVEEAAAWL